MRIVDSKLQPLEAWRPGVMTRMCVSATTGATQLCVFEQYCEPGTGAPSHMHAVEEVLTILDGMADFRVEDERSTLTAGQSVLVPAGHRHSFRNVGETTLHIEATLAAPFFEASFDEPGEVQRRWALPS